MVHASNACCKECANVPANYTFSMSIRRGLGVRGFMRGVSVMSLLVGLAYLPGCSTPPPLPVNKGEGEPQMLQAGDVLKIAFPGSQNLDNTQAIRRDGKINVYLAGEVQAAGKTPGQLEQELVELIGPQLVSKQVTVTVVSSSFSVFVTGAVIKPGKITPDHVITVLEGIMEAGGFDAAKADSKGVVVIRQESGKTVRYKVNVQAILDGKDPTPFYLRSRDIIFVPEKFSWF
jgi:polysaccharide biosynthesis/export protein